MVILSDRFWRTEFGGNPDVIGRTVKLNDEAYTIVGVMPATASVASWTGMASDVWVPLALTHEQRAARGNHNRDGVARLKRDVELEHAQSEMDAISPRLAREFPKSDDGWGAVVIPMQEEIVGNSRTMQPVGDIRTMAQVLEGRLTSQRFSALLLGLFAGVALLLAAVGIYSVLSYIVHGRSREIGIRTALGAQRADVLRLVIVEGMSPALVGVAAGTIAALASAKVMRTLVFGVSASDPLTLAAVGAMLALVALMASLVPAYRALRLDPVKVLRAE